MAKKKILLVDDETDILELLETALEETGRYEVRSEDRADRALAAAREFKPDLVILDLVMPGVDGSEIAALIKADPDLRNVPVVFSTGMVTPEESRDHGGIIGGYPVIPKPTDLAYLVKVIEAVLGPPRHTP